MSHHNPVTPPQKTQPRGCIQAADESAHATSAPLSPELSRLLAEAIAAQARRQQNAIKGALGQKAAALQRRQEWVTIAAQVIAGRPAGAFTLRSLAEVVARRAGRDCSPETIRKHLAEARILNTEKNG